MSRRRTLTPIEAIVQFYMRGTLGEIEQALEIASAIVRTRQAGAGTPGRAPRVRRLASQPVLSPLPPMPRPPRPLTPLPPLTPPEVAAASIVPPAPLNTSPAPRPRRRRGQGKPRPSRARRRVHAGAPDPTAAVETAASSGVDLAPLPDQGDPYDEDVPLPLE